MSELTAGELWARRDALEEDAATLLGKMLFEFARLDLNLGLCLAWEDGGSKLESLTKTVSTYNMNTKLDKLAKLVDSTLPHGSKRFKAYKTWLDRAHKVRQQRNELVHGRWGVDAANSQVVNIVGMPTSDDQREIRYSIEELASINDELRQLQRELSRLREHWPL